MPADWNADGCTDIVSGLKIYVSNCARAFAEIAASGPTTASAVMTGDWDGDGRADLLYTNVSNNSWYVQRSTGDGIAAPAATGIAAPLGSAWFVLDADGDGQVDLGYVDAANGNRLRYRLHNGSGTPPDLAVAFNDGFGINHTPAYVSISAGNYTRHTDAVFPEADFQSPLYVVRQVTASNGTGGTYQNLFQYYGARVHLQGRGFEGFYARRTFDTRSGLLTYDYAQRVYPYTGMHTQRSTWQGNGSKRIAEWSATVANQASGTGFEQRLFPYIATETDSRYEFGGTLDGALVSQTTTHTPMAIDTATPRRSRRALSIRIPTRRFSTPPGNARLPRRSRTTQAQIASACLHPRRSRWLPRDSLRSRANPPTRSIPPHAA